MALRNKDETSAEDTFEKLLAKLETICRTVEEHYTVQDSKEEERLRQELRVSRTYWQCRVRAFNKLGFKVKLTKHLPTKNRLDEKLKLQRPNDGQGAVPVDSDDEEY